jgi:hypothetical protein
MWARLVSAALGIWLMAAPAVLDYAGAARTNDRIVGPIVASLAVIAIWETTRSLRWANLPLGGWLLIAPWVLGYPADATWNSLVVGALLLALGLVRGPVNGHFGGGWSALWHDEPAEAASTRHVSGSEPPGRRR